MLNNMLSSAILKKMEDKKIISTDTAIITENLIAEKKSKEFMKKIRETYVGKNERLLIILHGVKKVLSLAGNNRNNIINDFNHNYFSQQIDLNMLKGGKYDLFVCPLDHWLVNELDYARTTFWSGESSLGQGNREYRLTHDDLNLERIMLIEDPEQFKVFK